MVYEVPKSKASIKQNRFEFVMPDDPDTTLSVPLLKYLKPSLVFELNGVDQTQAVRRMLEEYHPDIFDRFEDMTQITDLYEAWAAESGIELGESSASSDS